MVNFLTGCDVVVVVAINAVPLLVNTEEQSTQTQTGAIGRETQPITFYFFNKFTINGVGKHILLLLAGECCVRLLLGLCGCDFGMNCYGVHFKYIPSIHPHPDATPSDLIWLFAYSPQAQNKKLTIRKGCKVHYKINEYVATQHMHGECALRVCTCAQDAE